MQVFYKAAENPLNTLFWEQEVAGLVGTRTTKFSTIFKQNYVKYFGS